jgi:O-antigen ligase
MKKKLNLKDKVNIIFCIYPIIMLCPSAYITSYVTIFTLFAFYYFYKFQIKIKLFLIDYLLLFFFFISFLSTFINFESDYIILLKSLSDFRFILLFLVIRNLFIYKIIKYRILFQITLFCSIFLASDIFLQHILGHDIFGYKPSEGRYNGVFDDEAIAGSYIQKFFIISVLGLLFTNLSLANKKIFLFFFINFAGLGILFSLDRMPFLVYFFILCLSIFLIKNYKYIFTLASIFIFIFFITIFESNSKINYRYKTLQNELNFIKIFNIFSIKNNIGLSKNPSTEELRNYEASVINKSFFKGDYSRIIYSAYEVSKKNLLIGSGIKSFYIECKKLLETNKKLLCAPHPHNLYLEILVSTGMLGLFIFLLFVCRIIIDNLKIIINKNNINKKNLAIFSLILIISELFPLRSYGSIFQTVNGSMIWYLISIASALSFAKLKNLNK